MIRPRPGRRRPPPTSRAIARLWRSRTTSRAPPRSARAAAGQRRAGQQRAGQQRAGQQRAGQQRPGRPRGGGGGTGRGHRGARRARRRARPGGGEHPSGRRPRGHPRREARGPHRQAGRDRHPAGQFDAVHAVDAAGHPAEGSTLSGDSSDSPVDAAGHPAEGSTLSGDSSDSPACAAGHPAEGSTLSDDSSDPSDSPACSAGVRAQDTGGRRTRGPGRSDPQTDGPARARAGRLRLLPRPAFRAGRSHPPGRADRAQPAALRRVGGRRAARRRARAHGARVRRDLGDGAPDAAGPRLPPGRHLRGCRRDRGRRALPVPADARRDRPAPRPRGPPRAAVGRAGRARPPLSRLACLRRHR